MQTVHIRIRNSGYQKPPLRLGITGDTAGTSGYCNARIRFLGMYVLFKRVTDHFTGKANLDHARSSKWAKVREQFLKENPACAVCGSTKKLEAHHIIPFHLCPERELDPTNLIPLCESKRYGINCHLLFGHLGCYTSFNETVVSDAAAWNKKLSSRKS